MRTSIPSTYARRTRGAAFLATAVAVFAAVGCMEANPLPSPGIDGDYRQPDTSTEPVAPGGVDGMGQIAAGLTFVSALPAAAASGTVVLVGAPTAAMGVAEVVVRATALDFVATLPVAADGSFGTPIADARPGLVIEVAGVYETEAGEPAESTPFELTVRAVTGEETDVPWAFWDAAEDGSDRNSAGGAPPPGVGGEDPSLDEPLITLVDAAAGDDVVTVVGGPGVVTPQSRVLILNESRAVAYDVTARNDGSFRRDVAAAAGERLLVFAANPAAPALTTAATVVDVP